MKRVVINGHAFLANEWSNGCYYINATEISKLAKKLTTAIVKKASVKKTKSGAINIRLPKETTSKDKISVIQATSWLNGVTFDGMLDLETSRTIYSEDNERVYFGSKYIFVQVES